MSEQLQPLPQGPSQNLVLSILLYMKVVSSPYGGLLRLQDKYGDTFPIRVIGNPGVTIFTGNPQYVKRNLCASSRQVHDDGYASDSVLFR